MLNKAPAKISVVKCHFQSASLEVFESSVDVMLRNMV